MQAAAPARLLVTVSATALAAICAYRIIRKHLNFREALLRVNGPVHPSSAYAAAAVAQGWPAKALEPYTLLLAPPAHSSGLAKSQVRVSLKPAAQPAGLLHRRRARDGRRPHPGHPHVEAVDR